MKTVRDTIRADVYQQVVQHMQQGDGLHQIGRRVILPGSFVGGPRFMNQLYHDGMAVVRKLGKADLFITFTANPQWPEIAEAMREEGVCHVSEDRRYDIVSRVFRLKPE